MFLLFQLRSTHLTRGHCWNRYCPYRTVELFKHDPPANLGGLATGYQSKATASSSQGVRVESVISEHAHKVAAEPGPGSGRAPHQGSGKYAKKQAAPPGWTKPCYEGGTKGTDKSDCDMKKSGPQIHVKGFSSSVCLPTL